MISFTLRQNPFPTEEEGHTYVAQVRPLRTISEEELVEHMVELRGSTVTKDDAMATMNAHYESVTHFLSKGYNVTTPIATYSVSIRGLFTSVDDNFDPARHTVRVVVRMGRLLREAATRFSVSRKSRFIPMPQLEEVVDDGSGSQNEQITPDNGAVIKGIRLAFDKSDPNQGLFLVNLADGSEVRIDRVPAVRNREIICVWPSSLTSGDYQLHLRSVFGKDELRTGKLQRTLVVA